MGFELEQCCPVGYELENVKSHTNLEDAILGKDIICTDSIPDKAKVNYKEYRITLLHMKKANKGAALNPCPPFFRGEEIAGSTNELREFANETFDILFVIMSWSMLRIERIL